ncbi:MAG: MaoC family dehydratase N-terminal domain-containing protein [Gemmatimonadetes bacterium]|nr:MaoC family dehydratase N-terminal domain-containing protein [Gemmatimonadota bacterium]
MPRPPSPLRSMLRLMARGVGARGAAPALDASVPRRKEACERGEIRMDPAHVHDYARATGGDGVPPFFDDPPAAPPFYCATWETALALEMFAGLEAPLPLGAIVHVSTEMVWARPLPPGEPVRCRVELDRVDRTARGLKLTVLSRNWMGAGQLCSQGTSVFMVRLRPPPDGSPPADPPRREAAATAADAGGWTELARWPLPAGAGRRYARVSGDYNPIHLWPWTARPFGFRAPILHGYATAARAAHTLITQRLNGDPVALRRMRIAFLAPLPLPSTPVLLIDDSGPERRFRVAAPDGATVYAEGAYGAAA